MAVATASVTSCFIGIIYTFWMSSDGAAYEADCSTSTDDCDLPCWRALALSAQLLPSFDIVLHECRPCLRKLFG